MAGRDNEVAAVGISRALFARVELKLGRGGAKVVSFCAESYSDARRLTEA
jgi:hypothetical protein